MNKKTNTRIIIMLLIIQAIAEVTYSLMES